jgi:hypothetical protein
MEWLLAEVWQLKGREETQVQEDAFYVSVTRKSNTYFTELLGNQKLGNKILK